VPLDQGRKRLLAIVAGILVARRLKTADDLFDPSLAASPSRFTFERILRGDHLEDAMDSATERSYRRVKIIVLLLFIGGIVSALLGLATVAVGKLGMLGVMAGFLLLFGCVGAIAMAQLLELLTDIADHLAAIRAQLSKGVFGLLG
jgi:hypothetical protein